MRFGLRANSRDREAALIQAEGVAKSYGGRPALAVETFALRMGDRVLISGPSGSGKSTFLRMLAGITRCSRGSIRRSAEMRSLRVAYVPQVGGLYDNLTVRENLEMWRRLHGRNALNGTERQWYVEEMGLGRFLHLRAGQLSGGYRRIAVVACALGAEPHGLFLDEPFSGLDETLATRLREGLSQVSVQLRFLVVASHGPVDFPTANRTIRFPEGDVS